MTVTSMLAGGGYGSSYLAFVEYSSDAVEEVEGRDYVALDQYAAQHC